VRGRAAGPPARATARARPHPRPAPAAGSGLQYEGWLIAEARRRNPAIVTYALSWGVPAWVGDVNNSGPAFYSADNIAYQVSWVTCLRETTGESLDTIGLWNEKPQPPDASYVLALKAALAAAGSAATRIVVMDGQWDAAEFALARADTDFAASVYAAGLHYPCQAPHPEVADVGWALWASEDYSRDPAWENGGTYWGKALSQNYVLSNITATISWSLIWSAYTDLVCDGAGLMRAHTPWSGNYEVSAPIWLSAHTTQFTAPGWRYLSTASTGSGVVTGAAGAPAGTWVALVPPAGAPAGLTVVVETLVNDACVKRAYEPVTARFVVAGGAPLPAPGAALAVWRSRRDALFVREADVALAADGSFELSLMPDEIVTASTTPGATKGSFAAPVPAAAPWPLPFREDFGGYADGALARFFADQGGSFRVENGVYLQVAAGDPGSNGWGADVEPLTQVGSEEWADYAATVVVRFNATGPYGARARGPDGPLALAPCDAADAAQAFAAGPADGYLRNALSGGCMEVNGCGTLVDSYECVTEGASCGGTAPAYPNLRWSYDAATGALASANGGVLTAAANGTLYALPPAAGAAQRWDVNATTGQIALRGGAQCVSAPPRRVYARLCGRVSVFSGFAGDLTAYCLEVLHSGAWALVAHAGQGAANLAAGALDAFDAAAGNELGIAFAGPIVTASARGRVLAQVDGGATSGAGNILIGSGWHSFQFDDVRVVAA